MITVEVGGSSVQAVLFDGGQVSITSLDSHRNTDWLLASPGLVEGNRVRGAHHLNWMDVQASEELGMSAPPLISMNDADAAALGEWALRGQLTAPLLYISMGTGVGATGVDGGNLVHVKFGHLTSFGPKRCGGCGKLGCLDAQIGGHALPEPLADSDIAMVVSNLSLAMAKQDFDHELVVIGGGLPRRYPQIVSGLQQAIGRPVEASAAPDGFKSAAGFGLIHKWRTQAKEG